jgi:hypothetical protein
MDYEALKTSLLEALQSEDVKLAGYVAKPDYEKGDMDATHEAISEGRPVSTVPKEPYSIPSRTHPGHSGKNAPMKEKLENADGIDPKDWDDKKHGRKLASIIVQQVIEELSSGSDLPINELVSKSVRETIKKNLSPKETKMDDDVQGTSKPEKGDDDAAGKMVDEKAKKMKGKGKDTKKSAEEPDTMKARIKMPKTNPYQDHYDKFGEFAPQGARAAEIDNAVATNKPLKEDLKEEDAKKAFSDADYEKADYDYHAAKDRELEEMSDAEFNAKKPKRQVGGMSDAALDYGKTDAEAARNWDKKHGTKKGIVFKSLSEARAWNNPDPSLYKVRPTTTSERREFGPRMRFIVDEIPQREAVGAFGNRVVKGAKYNPKKDTLRGDKKLMPKDTVVHDVKNPTKHMDEQLDAAGKNPATVLAHRYKGPKGESMVQPPHSHGSDGSGFADSEESQKELRKAYDKNSGGGIPGDSGIYGRAYFDSHWGGKDDDDNDDDDYSDDSPQTPKVKKVAKSIVSDIVQEVLKSKFWEDKVINREDKYLASKEKKEAKPKEEKSSSKVRAAILSGESLKSVMLDIVSGVLSTLDDSKKSVSEIVEDVLKGYNPDVGSWPDDKKRKDSLDAQGKAMKEKAPHTILTSKEYANEPGHPKRGTTVTAEGKFVDADKA